MLNDFSVTVHIARRGGRGGGAVPLRAATAGVVSVSGGEQQRHARRTPGRFCSGLLQAQWTYTGFDASAHMSEETADPRRHAPWGIVLAVAVSGVAGYVLLLALTLAIHTIPAALHAKDAHGERDSRRHRDPAKRAWARESAMRWRRWHPWRCGSAAFPASPRRRARCCALARDGGTPFATSSASGEPEARHARSGHLGDCRRGARGHGLERGRPHRHRRSAPWRLYLAYITPGAARPGARGGAAPTGRRPRCGAWDAGDRRSTSPPSCYTVFICVVLVMPPNQLAGYTLAGFAGRARRIVLLRLRGVNSKVPPGAVTPMSVSEIVRTDSCSPANCSSTAAGKIPAKAEPSTSVNPATGELLTTVPDADACDVDRAVAAARESFEKKTWRGMDPSKKEQILWNICRAAGQASRTNWRCSSRWRTARRCAKPLAPTWPRHRRVPLLRRLGAQDLRRDHPGGRPVPELHAARADRAWWARSCPGIIRCSSPYGKLAPALACGCSVVLKPSEMTPLTALELAEYCMEAGLPEGVLNVVTGYGHTAGEAHGPHMDIDKISFTGSIRTARAADGGIGESQPEAPEPGTGRQESPNIIFPDCDMEAAVKAAFWGIFANKGEICSAGSRLLVHQDIHDSFSTIWRRARRR